jgi:hypothetical protein
VPRLGRSCELWVVLQRPHSAVSMRLDIEG